MHQGLNRSWVCCECWPQRVLFSGLVLKLLTLGLLAISATLSAQTLPKTLPQKVTTSSNDTAQQRRRARQILDFEAEVIEGERKTPDLFLQIGNDDLQFDQLLFLRRDFNDYEAQDRRWRTQMVTE